jgi:hypothetical protein
VVYILGTMAHTDDISKILARLTEESGADVLLCNASMDRGLERTIVDLCRERRRRDSVVVILVTSGGDADVAFRIARYLQCAYKKFTCIIPGWCKSAGTLLTLGAHEVVFGVHGELGPLDVQMAKKDELMGVESGLTVMTALTAIHEKTLLAFEHFFLVTTIKGGGRLTVQTASEIAVELAKGIFSPISEQIDPIHIGEAWRSMAIATEYGQRLIERSQNASRRALDKIITDYPSHGFVIDRIEAQTIFEHARECTKNEQELVDRLGEAALFPHTSTLVHFLNDEKEEQPNADADTVPEKFNDNPSPEAGADASQAKPVVQIARDGRDSAHEQLAVVGASKEQNSNGNIHATSGNSQQIG